MADKKEVKWHPLFKEVEEGTITIIHHSTASLIEIQDNTEDDYHNPQRLYLDYYRFSDLLNALDRIIENGDLIPRLTGDNNSGL